LWRNPVVNVTENLLRRYIEVFNVTFLDTACAFLPKEIPEMLFHYSLIQGRVVGYVSTQFGAGFEYIGAESPGIEIHNPAQDLRISLLGHQHVFRNSP